jgi:serine/threonine protein kinase
VTEYCARGSLDKLLHGPQGAGLTLTKRVEFALDVARGMAALHSQRPPVIHRDLKTANLLVTSRMEVKVADFGLSRIKDATHVSGSRRGAAAGARRMLCVDFRACAAPRCGATPIAAALLDKRPSLPPAPPLSAPAAPAQPRRPGRYH